MLNSTYRVRKRPAGAQTEGLGHNSKRARKTSVSAASKAQAAAATADNAASTTLASRGLGLSSPSCTPGKPPLPGTGSVLISGQKAPTSEVLGSRKSIRRAKLRLPATYDALLHLFEALQMIYRMNKLRGQHCVYSAIRQDVELQSRKRFTVEHLAQMKTVYPEVVSLSYVNIPKTGNQGTGAHCSGIQLLIELQLTDSAAMSAKNGACVGSSSSSSSSPDALGHSRILAANSTQARAASRAGQQEGAGLIGGAKAGAGVGLGGAVHMAAILTEFERRLEKQVTEYYTDLLEAASALADQHGDEDFDLEGLPDIVPAEIPAMPSKAGSGTASLAMPPQGPLGQGCPKSTAPGARCLSFGGCPGTPAEQDQARQADATEPSEEQLVQKLPQQLQEQFLLGELPVSLDALRLLHKQEVHRAAVCNPAAKLARRQSAAAAQLPFLFDALRAMFGQSGPCVRPYTLVLKQLTNSNKAASSLADVEDQLAALAAAAPEWITIETDLVGKKIVRLQRKVNNKQIRLRLMGMSGSRRASGAGLL